LFPELASVAEDLKDSFHVTEGPALSPLADAQTS